MTLAKGRHFDGIIGDEGWLNKVVFTFFREELVNEFSLTHCIIYLYSLVFAYRAQLIFRFIFDVYAGIFFDSLSHCKTRKRTFEIDFFCPNLNGSFAMNRKTNAFNHFFREVHHPKVIFVGYIDFHDGEFRVVGSIHPFISEITRELIHTVESTYNKSFEV